MIGAFLRCLYVATAFAWCLPSSAQAIVIAMGEGDAEWVETGRQGVDVPCEESIWSRSCSSPSTHFYMEIADDFMRSLANIEIAISSNEGNDQYSIRNHVTGSVLASGPTSWSYDTVFLSDDPFGEEPDWLLGLDMWGTGGSEARLRFDGNGALTDWDIAFNSCDSWYSFYSFSSRSQTQFTFGDCDAPNWTYDLQPGPTWTISTPAVPVPASVPLLISALGAFWGLRRFRTAGR